MESFKDYLKEESPQAKPSPNLAAAIKQANTGKPPELKYSIMDGKPMAIYSRPRDHEMTALKHAAEVHHVQFQYDNDKDLAILKDKNASSEYTHKLGK